MPPSPARRTLGFLARALGLLVAYVVLFLGGAGALGPAVDPATLTPAEQAASFQGTLLVALLDLAIVGGWIARARYGGVRLWLTAALVLYGVKTFSSQLETAYFVTKAHVPPEMLPKLFVMTLPLCLVWPGLAVWAFGPKQAVPAEPLRRSPADLAGRVLLGGAVLYPVLFFTFGYFVAWQNDAVRAYYEGPATPLPFLAHLGEMLAADPKVVPFEMARGLLWIAIGWPVLRHTRGPWWVGTLLYALMMCFVQNDLHVLPNPLMPAEVRYWHFLETGSSNFLFALGAGWLVRPRGR